MAVSVGDDAFNFGNIGPCITVAASNVVNVWGGCPTTNRCVGTSIGSGPAGVTATGNSPGHGRGRGLTALTKARV